MRPSLVKELWAPQQKTELTNKTRQNNVHQHSEAVIHSAESCIQYLTGAIDVPSKKFEKGIVHASPISYSHSLSNVSLNTVLLQVVMHRRNKWDENTSP